MIDKVGNVIVTLNKNLHQTCSDVDIFMKNILQWSDDMEKIIEKECLAKAGGHDHILPIIHSEKKTNVKDAKNSILSTTSVLNNTGCGSKNSNINDTASRKTRPAQIPPATKTFQLYDTKDKEEFFSATVKKECSLIANSSITSNTFVMPHTRSTRSKSSAIENLKNETFVVPQTASTRTKTVIKKKKEKNEAGNVKKVMEDVAVSKHSDQSFQNSILHDESQKISDFEVFSKTLSEKKNSSLQSKNSVKKVERVSCSKIFATSEADSKNTPDENKTFLNINSPEKQNNTLKFSKSFSNTLEPEQSKILIPDTPISSPLLRSSSLKNFSPSNITTKSIRVSIGRNKKSSRSKHISEENCSIANRTPGKKESSRNGATFLVSEIKEKEMSFEKSDRNVSPLTGETFTRFSKTSTPVLHKNQKIASFDDKSDEKHARRSNEMDLGIKSSATKRKSENSNSIENVSGVMKNNKKTKKEEIYKENIDEVASTVRITRTKSKALQKMMENPEFKELNDLSVFAKKLANKTKKNSLKKNQVAALLEKNYITPIKPTVHLPSELFSSKSKYHLLLSSSKKAKTPLATLPNSVIKIVKASNDKARIKPKIARRDSSAENLEQEKEEKLKSKQKKEEEAATKRQNVIKNKQAELKKKNERKHQLAMKQREKLEQEKYKNMIQSEKEKEERHKLILQERQMKMKENALKKKMLTQQKIAETNERRRLEEEARIAKLKEMEAEEQRIALEKQKEQEMLEKRAQERLAQKKAREEYELQLKKELEAEKMKAEKSGKKKLQSASKPEPSKRQKFEFFNEKKEEWDYKPRNENDYGLEHEESIVDSEDESNYKKNMKSPVPWVKKILKNSKYYSHVIPLDMLCEYMPCFQKTPDINKMFNITPTKKIKRNSSAIWNTPSF